MEKRKHPAIKRQITWPPKHNAISIRAYGLWLAIYTIHCFLKNPWKHHVAAQELKKNTPAGDFGVISMIQASTLLCPNAKRTRIL